MGGLVTEVERQYPKVWLITGSSGGVMPRALRVQGKDHDALMMVKKSR